ncbi:MAG: hypothetical protein M1274_06885 [Actinobacteria bacterium]|nr:hypothetical protein [Actinomycetota bacterium]
MIREYHLPIKMITQLNSCENAPAATSTSKAALTAATTLAPSTTTASMTTTTTEPTTTTEAETTTTRPAALQGIPPGYISTDRTVQDVLGHNKNCPEGKMLTRPDLNTPPKIQNQYHKAAGFYIVKRGPNNRARRTTLTRTS